MNKRKDHIESLTQINLSINVNFYQVCLELLFALFAYPWGGRPVRLNPLEKVC